MSRVELMLASGGKGGRGSARIRRQDRKRGGEWNHEAHCSLVPPEKRQMSRHVSAKGFKPDLLLSALKIPFCKWVCKALEKYSTVQTNRHNI